LWRGIGWGVYPARPGAGDRRAPSKSRPSGAAAFRYKGMSSSPE
jgi:hypothetical protein